MTKDTAVVATTTATTADASDQLDFPSKEQQQLEELEVRKAVEDFEAFTQSAESLKVPKETRDGNIVLTTGNIKPESTSKVDVAKEKPAANDEPRKITDIETTAIVKEESQKTAAAEATTTTTTPAADKHIHRFVTPKDFDLLKVIGMGAFGKVLQVRHRASNRILAMKVISKRLLRRKSGYVDNIQAERKILTRVRSPFVVTMHCSFQTREKLFIIMDFLAGGELFLRLGREGIFLEKEAAFYLAEIILALDHLHSLGILHRDLKPENILLGQDGHVCVTDFGLAKDFSDTGGFQNEDDESRALTICGTQEYMAPEMLSGQGYGRPADYWSLGCIAYEMLSGEPPFRSTAKEGRKVLFRKIMSEKVKMPVGSTAAACKLLKGLLNRNVQKRLGTTRNTMFEVGGVAGLKNQEFFIKIDWDKLERKEVTPPHVFDVNDDHDVQHFHAEFTGMALPRSVVEMSSRSYRPRRVESEAFRGFSFIQEDFDVPERDKSEIQSYWDSVEGDGESASECASSKLGEAEEPPELVPDKKKRPPRKRKKKKKVEVNAANTVDGTILQKPEIDHSISAESTPAPSEVGDGKDSADIRTNPVHTGVEALPSHSDAVLDPMCSQQSSSVIKPCDLQQGSSGREPSSIQSESSIAQASPHLKPVAEAWKGVSSNKKKATNRSTPVHVRKPQPALSRASPARIDLAQQPRRWAERIPKTTPASSQWSTVLPRQPAALRPTPWSQRAKQQNDGAWGSSATPNVSGASQSGWKKSPSRESINSADVPPSPSSDWRQHSMSPSSTTKHIIQPPGGQSWPSLGDDPPLNPSATVTKPVLKGAWASRVKS